MKALIIDNDAVQRPALRATLMQLDARLQVLEARTSPEALRLLSSHYDVDVVLACDPSLHSFALDLLERARERGLTVPIVVVSAAADPDQITKAIELGAMGFIPTSQSSELTVIALRLVLAGGIYLPREVVRRANRAAPQALPTPAPDYRELGLTDRQAQVLSLLIRGMPNKLICRELDLAEGTVKIHVTAILKALKVTNRTQAVIEAGRLGVKLPSRASSPGAAPP